MGFPGGLMGSYLFASVGDTGNVGSIPGQEDPLEKEMATLSLNSCLGNSTDRGVWQATIRGVTKSQTRLSTRTPKHQETLAAGWATNC